MMKVIEKSKEYLTVLSTKVYANNMIEPQTFYGPPKSGQPVESPTRYSVWNFCKIIIIPVILLIGIIIYWKKSKSSKKRKAITILIIILLILAVIVIPILVEDNGVLTKA